MGQSIGAHLVVASTLKLVRALDDNEADLDMGVMAMFGGARVGLAVKNLRTPEFSDGVERVRAAAAGADGLCVQSRVGQQRRGARLPSMRT